MILVLLLLLFIAVPSQAVTRYTLRPRAAANASWLQRL